jgi:UDP-glucose 4-epimerase
VTILVTGSAGFIGSHLIEKLYWGTEGTKTIGIDDFSLGKNKPRCNKMIKGRVQTIDPEEIKNADCIFNLAVSPLPQSLIEPKENWDNNVEILMAILEGMRKYNDKAKLVHISSSEALGTLDSHSKDAQTETFLLQPRTVYASSKAACDHLALSYEKTYGMDIKIARPFNAYGPGQNDGSYAALVPLTIKKILAKKLPIVTGDGQQTRDFSYVDDTVNGILAVAKHGYRGEIYHICSGKEVSVLTIVEIIARIMGWDKGFNLRTNRSADVLRHKGSYAKLNKLCGWEPKVTLEDGLRKTIDWYTKQSQAKH